MADERSVGRKVKKVAEVDEVARVEAEQAEGLPTPEVLAKYEKVVPGGAARLLELALERERHEHAMEKRTLETEIKLEKFKQVAKFILALVAGVFGGMLLLNGSELAGLIIILVDAAAIVGVAMWKKES